MSDDVEVVKRFREALARDDFDAAAALLAEDVEVTTPKRTIRGLDEVRASWEDSRGYDHLEVELEPAPLEAAGDGRVVSENRQVFRWKDGGEYAYDRRLSVEYRVRDGKIELLRSTVVKDAA